MRISSQSFSRVYLIAQSFASSTINQKLSAIRRLAVELGDNGIIPVPASAAISRVRGVRMHGVRLGRWLTPAQAAQLLETPDSTTLKGKRDRALIAVLLGCGLRRTELANLSVDTLQRRLGRWVLVDIRGKHGRIRSVPLADWTKDIVDNWLTASGITSGSLFRAVDKAGRVRGQQISPQAVYEVITGYGIDMGVRVAPHDLRRSFARLAHNGRSPLEQIQLSLGHASVATTERYVGAQQDLTDAPCDHLGIPITNHGHSPVGCCDPHSGSDGATSDRQNSTLRDHCDG